MLIQYRVTDVHHTVDLVAGEFLVAAPTNLVQVAVETSRDCFSGAETPGSERPGTNFVVLKSQNYVSRSCVQKVNVGSQPHGEAHDPGRVELRYNHHFSMVEHCQMAGLASVARDPLQQRARLRDKPLQRMMVMDNLK